MPRRRVVEAVVGCHPQGCCRLLALLVRQWVHAVATVSHSCCKKTQQDQIKRTDVLPRLQRRTVDIFMRVYSLWGFRAMNKDAIETRNLCRCGAGTCAVRQRH